MTLDCLFLIFGSTFLPQLGSLQNFKRHPFVLNQNELFSQIEENPSREQDNKFWKNSLLKAKPIYTTSEANWKHTEFLLGSFYHN